MNSLGGTFKATPSFGKLAARRSSALGSPLVDAVCDCQVWNLLALLNSTDFRWQRLTTYTIQEVFCPPKTRFKIRLLDHIRENVYRVTALCTGHLFIGNTSEHLHLLWG